LSQSSVKVFNCPENGGGGQPVGNRPMKKFLCLKDDRSQASRAGGLMVNSDDELRQKVLAVLIKFSPVVTDTKICD
jgi:hypothetical protein